MVSGPVTDPVRAYCVKARMSWAMKPRQTSSPYSRLIEGCKWLKSQSMSSLAIAVPNSEMNAATASAGGMVVATGGTVVAGKVVMIGGAAVGAVVVAGGPVAGAVVADSAGAVVDGTVVVTFAAEAIRSPESVDPPVRENAAPEMMRADPMPTRIVPTRLRSNFRLPSPAF